MSYECQKLGVWPRFARTLAGASQWPCSSSACLLNETRRPFQSVGNMLLGKQCPEDPRGNYPSVVGQLSSDPGVEHRLSGSVGNRGQNLA